MEYTKAKKYDTKVFNDKIMGPNPIKLEEELMVGSKIPEGATVIDLGSGQGVTSVFLAKEYGLKVYAADLWSEPEENQKFFSECGLNEEQLKAVKADAENLPFEREFFDAVVSTDSYNYFGRDPEYLGSKLLPFVKHGGYIYIAIPGMKADYHANLPAELLLSWNEEQMEYMQDVSYWRNIISQTDGIEIITVEQMQSNEEVWEDWIKQENEYAVGDRKSVNAGACEYLNFIKIVIRKK